VLHSKIRFAHSLAYIRGLAHAHRFSELIANEITVRNSGTAPVAGWLVVLQAK
jgi:predicted TPR repeat methyltransferase